MMDGSLMFWLGLLLVSLLVAMIARMTTMLALAVGSGIAALFAWIGFGFLIDLIVAVVVGFATLMWLRRSSQGQALLEAADSRPSVISDDGDEVNISRWDSAEEVRVTYRGHHWEAKLAPGSKAHSGKYKVSDVREGKLILEEK